jgi:hypothetical protein
MVNKTQFYKTKVCLAVIEALRGSYFYSDKTQGNSMPLEVEE